MLDTRECQSKAKYRVFDIAFSLPRGERMRCGVFLQFQIALSNCALLIVFYPNREL
jgi:hypothetical protein